MIALDKAIKACDVSEEVEYRELVNEIRKAKVGDVEVNFEDSSSTITGFSVNWPGIGSTQPAKATKFANDIIKAASNAMKLESKYKGKKIAF